MTGAASFSTRGLSFLRQRFEQLGDAERAAAQRAYMKSTLRFHGVSNDQLAAAVKELLDAHPPGGVEDVRALVDAAYDTDWFDLRSAALLVAGKKVRLLGGADLDWLIGLVRRSRCWAQVDYLAVKVVGGVLSRDRAAIGTRLRAWATDGELWVRRTALLATLEELRKGGGDLALFTEIAAPMLPEKEFFIRKAIGWVLREVARKRPGPVLSFLQAHRKEVSGLTLREAAKHLPPPMREALGLPAAAKKKTARSG